MAKKAKSFLFLASKLPILIKTSGRYQMRYLPIMQPEKINIACLRVISIWIWKKIMPDLYASNNKK